MRTYKLYLVLACALVLAVIAVATASASTLPGVAKTSIAGESEKATLQVKGGASFTCPKSTLTGEVLSTAESSATINFGPKCTTAGLPLNSLGDAAGTILVPVEIKECAANASILKLVVLPLHLEAPSTKLLLTLQGTLLVEVTASVKQKNFALRVDQKEGKNAIETCGKEKLILEFSTDGGAFVQSGEEAKNASLQFGTEEEFM